MTHQYAHLDEMSLSGFTSSYLSDGNPGQVESVIDTESAIYPLTKDSLYDDYPPCDF